MEKSSFGFLAERHVAQFLENEGYKFIESNYRRPWGEIDLVVKKGKVLTFVEVKASEKDIEGFQPELRVTSAKIKKIVRTAHTYLAEKKYRAEQEWQIDVVSVTMEVTGKPLFRHYKNVTMV